MAKRTLSEQAANSSMTIDLELLTDARQYIVILNRSAGVMKRQFKSITHPAIHDNSKQASIVRSTIDQYVAMTQMFNAGYDDAKQYAIEAQDKLKSLVPRYENS